MLIAGQSLWTPAPERRLSAPPNVWSYLMSDRLSGKQSRALLALAVLFIALWLVGLAMVLWGP